MPVTTGKRKKTADMPDSPPKRATRARTKATDDLEEKPKTTKITTASTKATAEKQRAALPARAGKRKTKTDDEDVEMVEGSAVVEEPKPKGTKAATAKTKKSTAPAKTSKRKTRADDEELEAAEEPVGVEEGVVVEQPKAEPVKAKGRENKAAEAKKEESETHDLPKTRGRQPRAAVPKTTRGRPKKETATILKAPEEQSEVKAPEPVKKTTRGRAAAPTSKATTATTAKPTAATTKKRVKFQEEEPDKENIPIEKTSTKKSAMKPTGMKAKPVRKPAATRGSIRGKKAIQEDAQTTEVENKRDSMPLSPKKVHQVAKSDPISSEDELAGGMTPMRALSKSPAKRPMSPIKDMGNVSKLNFNQQTAPSSPAKTMSSSILASPARRPPPSPYKGALKSSPKKVYLGDSIAQPVLLSSRTPMKGSLLQESPKRGNLEITLKPTLTSSQSPSKASLLQSPARRPTVSPKKPGFFASPQKSSTASHIAQPSATSPEQNLESRAVAGIVGQETTALARGGQLLQPERQNAQDLSAETTVMGQLSADEMTVFPGETPNEVSDSMAPKDITKERSNPEEPVMYKAPAFSIASSAFRRISIESEGSEDELASPQKGYEATPLGKFGASTKDSRTPIVMPDPREPSNSNVSFTPLADKLSTWAASSPNKQNGVNRSRQARGLFSIGDVDTMGSDDQISYDIPATTPVKTSFFDDEMAVRDEEEAQMVTESAMAEEQNLTTLKVSQESQASEEYGDENAAPTEAEMLRAEQEAQDPTKSCTPAKFFTPARVLAQQPREFHTVSKVPLRASAEDSTLKVPRQRSRSFGGPLAVVKTSIVSEGPKDQDMLDFQPATPMLKATAILQTPSSGMKLDAETPGRTVRKGVVPDVLKGAVVYVDVHTTEGADASGIFVDLLTQMGARCVKQWSWNPRASIASPLDGSGSPQVMSPELSANKVGITHVVYKDGGKRTLEKVRASNGIVLCIGVGWVLE